MKILSISAAPGWFGLFEQHDGSLDRIPLACWALVPEKGAEGRTEVVGMQAEQESSLIDRSDDAENFKGYWHESEDAPKAAGWIRP
jgi:hypothetical protein